MSTGVDKARRRWREKVEGEGVGDGGGAAGWDALGWDADVSVRELDRKGGREQDRKDGRELDKKARAMARRGYLNTHS